MKKILVVDDELDIVNIVKSVLERQKDYEVSTACDAEEALRMLEDEMPDLVLLDIVLPRMSGGELLKHIRTELKTEIPVIISTAKRETELLLAIKEMGATDYLMKPYDIRELNKVICTYI